MKKQTSIDDWQIILQPEFEGARRGIALFVFSPSRKVEKKVVVWGEETGNCGGVARAFAEHCAIKFHRKLLESGIDISDARRRIAAEMGERWNG
jgi:hypothetical protein